MEVVTQCGTALLFQPLDQERRKVAELINLKEADSWVFKLSRLKKGECIACGNFVVGSKETIDPLVITADLKGGFHENNKRQEVLRSDLVKI